MILDASFALDLVASDEGEDLEPAARAIARGFILVPPFFWHEVANGLRNMHLRGRMSRDARNVALQRLRLFPVETELAAPPIQEVLAVCDRFQLTVYDAAYLELAIRTGSALATRDKGLGAAAAKAGVSLAVAV